MKYKEDYTEGTYIDAQEVRDFIEAHAEVTIDVLYKSVLELAEKIKANQEARNSCDSDFAYWGYFQTEVTYKACKRYCEDRILQMLEATGSDTLDKVDREARRRKAVINKCLSTIDDLNKYRPAGYKRTIDCLTDIVNTKEETD